MKTKTIQFSDQSWHLQTVEIPVELYEKLKSIYDGIETARKSMKYGYYSDAEIDLQTLIDERIDLK